MGIYRLILAYNILKLDIMLMRYEDLGVWIECFGKLEVQRDEKNFWLIHNHWTDTHIE